MDDDVYESCKTESRMQCSERTLPKYKLYKGARQPDLGNRHFEVTLKRVQPL